MSTERAKGAIVITLAASLFRVCEGRYKPWHIISTLSRSLKGGFQTISVMIRNVHGIRA